MAKTAKRNVRGQHVSDSTLLTKGRKALMKAAGMGNGAARSPLTQQLLDTIQKKDSYVSIPLTNGRTKATTVFNLKDKAKRSDVILHWTLSQDEKAIYAWFTRKAPIKAVGKKVGNGPKAIPQPEAQTA